MTATIRILPRMRGRRCLVVAGLTIAVVAGVRAQPAVNWTSADDHRDMMERLGIRSLRPGPSGSEQAPNHANYDEATANPFPELPDALTLKNGSKVHRASDWGMERRPQTVDDFQRQRYDCIPSS